MQDYHRQLVPSRHCSPISLLWGTRLQMVCVTLCGVHCVWSSHLFYSLSHSLRLYQLSKEDRLPMPAINVHDSVVKVGQCVLPVVLPCPRPLFGPVKIIKGRGGEQIRLFPHNLYSCLAILTNPNMCTQCLPNQP